MAAIAEVVTTSAHGQGPVLLAYTSDTVGRVIEFEVDLADTWLPIMGGNPEQIVEAIQTGKATGKIRVTVDEISDWDATTVRGKQASVTLMQAKPLASTKRWKMSASTAFVNVMSFKGDRNKNTSTAVLEITPYAAVGSSPWTFTDDEADA